MCILVWIYLIILSYRSYKVYKLKLKILYENLNEYKKMPSFDKMVYSFKPIKKESWIDKKNEI